MLTTTRVLVIVALMTTAALAQKPKEPAESVLRHYQLEVGQIGRFPQQDDRLFYKVAEVVNDKEMVILPARDIPRPSKTYPEYRFIIQGQITKGLVDGKRIELSGLYKVAETKKHKDRTMFVVTPVGPDTPPRP